MNWAEPAWIETACNALSSAGWFVADDAVDPALIDALAGDLHTLAAGDRLRRAGIGRDEDYQLARRVRGDRIFWLESGRPAQAAFMRWAEAVRVALNRRLFLGLFEFEAHLAVYPQGAFYRRHVDAFRGADNRKVSMVVYLNRNWQADDGGELVIHDARRGPVHILPEAGRLVLMMSEEVEHEVRPARVARASVAGWFRVNASTAARVDPPR